MDLSECTYVTCNIQSSFYAFAILQCWRSVFRLSVSRVRPLVHLSAQILLLLYLMNGFNSLDETLGNIHSPLLMN